MSAATLPNGGLLPRSPGGNGPGAVLALLVHAGLVVALTVSVDWRSQPADVVAAELWASVPQVAAPPPVQAQPLPEPQPRPLPRPQPEPRITPPPAPRAPTPANTQADIAVERAERRKAEADIKKREDRAEADRKRADADKKKREDDKKRREDEAREAAAQDKRLAEQRQANLRRMMGEAATATTGRTGSAAQDAAPSAAYAGRVAALIRRSSVFTGSVPGNPAAEVEVRAAASGSIIARRLVKSSGHKAWDDAVLQAIDKAGTLPRDTDGRVPAQIIIAFRPKDE